MIARLSTKRMMLFALVAVFVGLPASRASDLPKLTVGDRVRVAAVEQSEDWVRNKEVTGTLLGLDENSITVENVLTGAVSVFARESVSKIEISRGGSQKGRGALKGLAIGAGAGAVVGLVASSGDDFYGPAAAAVILAGLFGAVGAMIGALEAPGEQWEPITLGQASLGFGSSVPSGDGIFVSVSW